MANFSEDIFDAFDEEEEPESCVEPVIIKIEKNSEEAIKSSERGNQLRLMFHIKFIYF